ncbi:YdcF family protein [Rhodovibrio sodomensis]|nr:YdcF family protein [Rhodovibrio sodomensis]
MDDGAGGRDSVIVLGAAFRDGRRGPNPALVRRARHGARLTLGRSDRVLVAVGGGAAREAAAIAEVAGAAGVPPAAILAEARSRNTLQNAVLTAHLVRRHGLRGGYLVTDWPHMPRAWLCFRLAGVRCRPAPVPGTAGKPGFWMHEAMACAAYLARLPRLLRAARRLRTRPWRSPRARRRKVEPPFS